MRNLLSAYLGQLKKSRLFKGILIFAVGMGIYVPIQAFMEIKSYGAAYTLESRVTWHLLILGFLTAVFVSWFLGMEHSDGVIRNKMIAGYSRTQIYLSSFLSCTFAIMLVDAVHLLVLTVLGRRLIADFKVEAAEVACIYGLSLLLCIVFTAIFTLITMLAQNKAFSSSACLVVCMLLFLASFYVMAKLSAQETITHYVMTSDGAVEPQEAPNPQYLEGSIREVYTFFSEFLPFGQVFLLVSRGPSMPYGIMYLYDFISIAALTGIGLLFFKRRNIK